jgi:hypothetical protein
LAPAKSKVSASATTTSKPSGSARWRTTSMVCGWQSAATKKWSADLSLAASWHKAIASAAAVPSSSIEALAISMPVSSQTIVWKASISSRRPWLISAW